MMERERMIAEMMNMLTPYVCAPCVHMYDSSLCWPSLQHEMLMKFCKSYAQICAQICKIVDNLVSTMSIRHVA